jgi:hypothetical protein
MGVEQKLGNMGVVTTTLEECRQLVAHECHVADVVRSGLLRH